MPIGGVAQIRTECPIKGTMSLADSLGTITYCLLHSPVPKYGLSILHYKVVKRKNLELFGPRFKIGRFLPILNLGFSPWA